MKKPERELIREERRRLGKKTRVTRRTSGFAIWGRILSLLTPIALVSLVVAAYFTPLFAISRISVTGNERIEATEVSAALSDLLGRPLPTITEDEVAQLLGDFGLIETFALQAEPPSTLRIKLRERQPLAILVRGGENFLYDAAGIEIAPTDQLGDFPFFIFDGDPLEDPRYRVGTELLLSLPRETYNQVFSLEVSSALTARLELREQNLKVIWGGTDQALLKAEVMNSLIATGLEDGVIIDVSSPTSPVVRYPN